MSIPRYAEITPFSSLDPAADGPWVTYDDHVAAVAEARDVAIEDCERAALSVSHGEMQHEHHLVLVQAAAAIRALAAGEPSARATDHLSRFAGMTCGACEDSGVGVCFDCGRLSLIDVSIASDRIGERVESAPVEPSATTTDGE